MRVLVAAAVAGFLLAPVGGPTGAAGNLGSDVRQDVSDASAIAKKKKAPRKAAKKEEYLRAAPSEPPLGAKKRPAR
jgi:hypothetical protein